AILQVVPADQPLQIRRENADHLAIDVVDRGRGEQQSADGPAHTPDRTRCLDDRVVMKIGIERASRKRRHAFTPLARNPPSTTSTWPVTNRAPSDARNPAAPASSSTHPKRRIGVRVRNS